MSPPRARIRITFLSFFLHYLVTFCDGSRPSRSSNGSNRIGKWIRDDGTEIAQPVKSWNYFDVHGRSRAEVDDGADDSNASEETFDEALNKADAWKVGLQGTEGNSGNVSGELIDGSEVHQPGEVNEKQESGKGDRHEVVDKRNRRRNGEIDHGNINDFQPIVRRRGRDSPVRKGARERDDAIGDFKAAMRNALLANEEAKKVIDSGGGGGNGGGGGGGEGNQGVTVKAEDDRDDTKRKNMTKLRETRLDTKMKMAKKGALESSVMAGNRKVQESKAKFRKKIGEDIKSNKRGVEERSSRERPKNIKQVKGKLKSTESASHAAEKKTNSEEKEDRKRKPEMRDTVLSQDDPPRGRTKTKEAVRAEIKEDHEVRTKQLKNNKVKERSIVRRSGIPREKEKEEMKMEDEINADTSTESPSIHSIHNNQEAKQSSDFGKSELAKKPSDAVKDLADAGAEKDEEIEAKLKNIETMQKTIKQTLDNTTMSLNEIQKLKSELEQKVKTVDAKEKEMEGTREELKAAVSKIADVGKDLFETQSILSVGRSAALDQATKVENKETELGVELDKTASEILEEKKENLDEKLELQVEKSAVEAKEMIVDEEAASQLDRTVVINDILNETKQLLEEEKAEDLDEVKEEEEALKKEEGKIAMEEEKVEQVAKVVEKTKNELETIAANVTANAEIEAVKVATAEKKTKAIASKAKVIEEEKEDLETIVKQKEIELAAKEKALDSRVIDAIVNKTAEIIGMKVQSLGDELRRKIDETVKKPELVSATPNATVSTLNVTVSTPNVNSSTFNGNASSTNATISTPSASSSNVSLDGPTNATSGDASSKPDVDAPSKRPVAGPKGAGSKETKISIVDTTDSSNTTTRGNISNDGSFQVDLPSAANVSDSNGTSTNASMVVSTSSPPTSASSEDTLVSTDASSPAVIESKDTSPSSTAESSGSSIADSTETSALSSSVSNTFVSNSSVPNSSVSNSVSNSFVSDTSVSNSSVSDTSVSNPSVSNSVSNSFVEISSVNNSETTPASSSISSSVTEEAVATTTTATTAATAASATTASTTTASTTTTATTTTTSSTFSTSGTFTTRSRTSVVETSPGITTVVTNDAPTSAVTPMKHMIYVGKVGEDEDTILPSISPPATTTTMTTTRPETSNAAEVSHMVLGNNNNNKNNNNHSSVPLGNAAAGAEHVKVSEKDGGKELEIDMGGNSTKNESVDVVVDAPNQMVMVQNNVSKTDKSVNGKLIISESVHIVNKPIDALTPEDKLALVKVPNDDYKLAALLHEEQDSTTTPFYDAAALMQEMGDDGGRHSDFVGTGGWVFIALLVCLLCVLIVVGAVYGARRRHVRKAQECNNKDRPDSLTAMAGFMSLSSEPRRSFSPQNERSNKKLPLSQRIAAAHQNRAGNFSAGYVDEMSRMPESSDLEIGTRQTFSQ